MIDRDRCEGCLLGLALGDALGAPFEGGPIERLLWRVIGKTRRGETRFTDDTQMTLDVAESLAALGQIDPDDLARRFAASYRWSRGYGPGAARVLKEIGRGSPWQVANRLAHADGSFGNGGAMRSAPVGLFFASRPEELVEAARRAARVTHAHPLGEEGAVLIAVATVCAAAGDAPSDLLAAVVRHSEVEPFQVRLRIARDWIEADASPDAPEVSGQLGNGIAAVDSCITAIYSALRFRDRTFLELLEFVAGIGGDVDTIGAMAGALWGATNGAEKLPPDRLSKLEQRDRLVGAAGALFERIAAEG